MNSLQAYVLAKKYTQETAEEFGAVQGAPCQIASIEEKDGEHKITFEWKNSVGETRTTTITVHDGDNIYEWIPGDSYEYGDVVIYEDCFYLCTVSNNDSVFNPNKFKAIGTADGNYGLVEDESYLPSGLNPSDRKMYYSIADECYWLWNGTKWEKELDSQPLTTEQLNNLIALL